MVLACAAAIFLTSIVSPPSLMDDVDGAHAQIARNMLVSGDWVTPRLDGVLYVDKAPLHFWLIAASYGIFGVHDWAARIPLALSCVLLCWITARFGRWAFSAREGLYAGLALSTCVGLFLFTRVLIPDAILTLLVTLAMWALLRALDPLEPGPRLWAALLAASLGLGILVKGLMAPVILAGGGVIYLLATGQLFSRRTWQRLHPWTGLVIILAIAAPWHVLAMLRNPPAIDWTFQSPPDQYHGFFWRYFINEHVLRYLNLRYPRDYDTVPRIQFWVLHLVWLFPWSLFFPAAATLAYRPVDRAGKARLLALCWTAFLLIFFSFSTTQEYYTMPCYPALALLTGCALAGGSRWVRRGEIALLAVAALAIAVIAFLLVRVWNVPAPGDISSALASNPEAYTLSLGHLQDLTLNSFAYLKAPLAMAGAALLVGVLGLWLRRRLAVLAIVLMMAIFVQAARQALRRFDPYLTSRPLADLYMRQPPGILVTGDEYWAFSSLLFYTNQPTLLWRGRFNNLEYGSYAPEAPHIFLNDSEFQRLWRGGSRVYLLVMPENVKHARALLGDSMELVAGSGGKVLYSNVRP